VVLSSAWISCVSNVDTSVSENTYFDLDSLISSQILLLVDLDPEITKDASLGDQKEQAGMRLDSLGWEKELKVFRDANINKPAYRGLYQVSKGIDDSYSNLLYDSYLLKNEGHLPVKDLRVFYLEEVLNVKKVEVELNENNELFESKRSLVLEFEEIRDKPVLRSYVVKGEQKLTLNDQVNYEVSVQLNF
jgi:hypothetical protein